MSWLIYTRNETVNEPDVKRVVFGRPLQNLAEMEEIPYNNPIVKIALVHMIDDKERKTRSIFPLILYVKVKVRNNTS